MNPLYYQYGMGSPAMQTPDYQTFLKLLEQMRQQNGGDGSKGQSSGGQQGGGMSGLSSLFKMFGGSGGGAPSMSAMNGAAAPGYFDSPTPMLGTGGFFA